MEEEKTVETLDTELPKKKKEDKKGNKLKEEIAKLKEENANLNDKILRLSAETQNMKRHFDEDKLRLIKYDGEKVILDLLPVLDNFERAISLDDANLEDELSKFLSGFKMIYAGLKDTLSKYGVKEIECIHEKFNPNTMNAVMIGEDETLEPNTVIDCMQKGYIYKDKVIRPAMVKVNKESD